MAKRFKSGEVPSPDDEDKLDAMVGSLLWQRGRWRLHPRRNLTSNRQAQKGEKPWKI
jgi:hypothetical protein